MSSIPDKFQKTGKVKEDIVMKITGTTNNYNQNRLQVKKESQNSQHDTVTTVQKILIYRKESIKNGFL